MGRHPESLSCSTVLGCVPDTLPIWVSGTSQAMTVIFGGLIKWVLILHPMQTNFELEK